ncbi:hypothetical protein [Paractinoplanes durhamensis]|uniref:Uncharacterized protein n=1 Tax=Paractinoplanes durhamensis TaxID=113563 RepID=A0ABQ3ZBR6_9ACTN|nr:hypothetical protein [Actinoplanes durhamensis]GIE07283.1 hypothetical protein Adu01nite_86330 [Actinoplanes durhamensis]
MKDLADDQPDGNEPNSELPDLTTQSFGEPLSTDGGDGPLAHAVRRLLREDGDDTLAAFGSSIS